MWQTETFDTKEEMKTWLDDHEGEIQYEEVFLNNGYGVLWRPLRKIYVEDEDE